MSKILSIGTAVPDYAHSQDDIFDFMHRVYALDESGRRKLKFLYRQGGINTRYSVIPDYSLPASDWTFYPSTENLEPFPSLEDRMKVYKREAASLSMKAIQKCLSPGDKSIAGITHLITVSCTGMSAPGLDLELMELLGLPASTQRFSVNFMGCYAAIHALKMADAFCKADPGNPVKVLVVCTELCTLHFQKEAGIDTMTSSMLFSDGAAAVVITNNSSAPGPNIDSFYSCVFMEGKNDMAWQLSSKGFQMTLSGYIADLIGADFSGLVNNALESSSLKKDEITHWCIHPGGRKILEAVSASLELKENELYACYQVLRNYGNMSSPTVLFVLEQLIQELKPGEKSKIFGAAFGPGLTMETIILSS